MVPRVAPFTDQVNSPTACYGSLLAFDDARSVIGTDATTVCERWWQWRLHRQERTRIAPAIDASVKNFIVGQVSANQPAQDLLYLLRIEEVERYISFEYV